MATLSTAARNAAVDAVVALLETGATLSGVRLAIVDSGFVSVIADQFPSPAFGAAVNGRADLLAVADLAAQFSGTPDQWFILSRANSFVFSNGTVGDAGSGAEIEFSPSNLPLLAGQKLRIASLYLEMA